MLNLKQLINKVPERELFCVLGILSMLILPIIYMSEVINYFLNRFLLKKSVLY
jgi:hypothetical protein